MTRDSLTEIRVRTEFGPIGDRRTLVEVIVFYVADHWQQVAISGIAREQVWDCFIEQIADRAVL